VPGVRLRDGEAEAALTGRERITEHDEYLWMIVVRRGIRQVW
jgi:hypothetical protein